MVKFREVSGDVWVCWKGIVTEKTLKEERKNKNDFYDNYNLVYSAHNYYISIFQLTYYTNVTDERRT